MEACVDKRIVPAGTKFGSENWITSAQRKKFLL